MSKRQKTERRELCSRIQSYFESPDREMWKLGRQLCHQFRINYWVQCNPFKFDFVDKRSIKRLSNISIKSIPGRYLNIELPQLYGQRNFPFSVAIYNGPSISYQIILNGYKKAKRKRKRVFQKQRS